MMKTFTNQSNRAAVTFDSVVKKNEQIIVLLE